MCHAICAALWSVKMQMSSGPEMPRLVRIRYPGDPEEQRGAGASFWGRTTQFASLISLSTPNIYVVPRLAQQGQARVLGSCVTVLSQLAQGFASKSGVRTQSQEACLGAPSGIEGGTWLSPPALAEPVSAAHTLPRGWGPWLREEAVSPAHKQGKSELPLPLGCNF